ncbi:hypothetical protein PMAYCL1PPCAC_00697, partial [Pristionchus mayeri]
NPSVVSMQIFNFLFPLVSLAESFKFLAYSPQFAVSHTNFIAKISGALVEAGHEVVIVAPRIHPSIRGALSKKARVIELPENEHTRGWYEAETRTMDNAWNSSILEFAMDARKVLAHQLDAANATIHYPGLVEQLREEKFDTAFSENPIGFGLFYLAGIERTALAVSFTNFECGYSLTQMPSAPSYVPSIMSPYGDRMSFFQRVVNTLTSLAFGLMFVSNSRLAQSIFDELTPGVALHDIVANNSLMFLNSEPLLDYPRPTVHRVIDIGGIAMATEAELLDEYWSSVLDRRNRTVILSFGTYIRASRMPEIYKTTIRNALSKFYDVTFIWKYENPDHNVSQGINNIVETTWLPQVALLNDPRLTAFITHGGQGSTLEAAYAGQCFTLFKTVGSVKNSYSFLSLRCYVYLERVYIMEGHARHMHFDFFTIFSGKPMLMMPTQGDQHRNAAMIKRAGLGEIMQFSDLEQDERLKEAIRDLLENEEYTIKAKHVAAMLKDRPISAKEKLVRNMEFLARYGPLRMLDHEGRNLNFIQYYLIDVFVFLAVITLAIVGLIGTCCFISCRFCSRKVHRKYVSL